MVNEIKNNDELSNDIIQNSFYAIYYYHLKGEIMSNIKLQKVLYLVEGLFTGKISYGNALFSDSWNVKEYGPMSDRLYDYYRNFKGDNIILTEEELELAKELPELNKKLIEIIFCRFGKMDTFDLVKLTHLSGSPWDNAKKSYGDIDFDKCEILIDKKETGDWYCSLFNC